MVGRVYLKFQSVVNFQSLSREANSEEMKSFCSKTNFDFVAKTLSFIRKNDVTSVLLLFDVLHHNDELLHHGYSLPDFRSENTNDVSVEVCNKRFLCTEIWDENKG